MVIAAGMDWNSPYSCKDWVKKFMLTFPVIDDTKGRSIYNHFGDGIVPFNIVINRYGQLVYSKSGFNNLISSNKILTFKLLGVGQKCKSIISLLS